MNQTKKTEIGEHTFYITRLPPTLGLDLLSEVLQGVGPALGTLFERFKLGEIMAARGDWAKVASGVDFSGLGEAVKKLVLALGKKELRSIAQQSLASTTCSTAGGKLVWEKGGAPLVDGLNLTAAQLLRLIWESLVWNFEDFFSALSGKEAAGAEGAEGSGR